MPREGHTPWSDRENAYLVKWWGVKPASEIAYDLVRSGDQVRAKARYMNLGPGVKEQGAVWTAERDRALRAGYARGWSVRALARKLGFATRTIVRRLKALDLPVDAVTLEAGPRRKSRDLPKGDDKFVARMFEAGYGDYYNPRAVGS